MAPPLQLSERIAACFTPNAVGTRTVGAARITTFDLYPDKDGSGFSTGAEHADTVFVENILPLAPRMPGFVNVQRLVDHRLGVFKILSLWESEEDCIASGQSQEYYENGQSKLRVCARFGMFKTEIFKVWKIYPDDESVTITTPYAAVSVMELNGKDEAVKMADESLQCIAQDLKRRPGLSGLLRLTGTGDAQNTYMIVLFWESQGALTASYRGVDPLTAPLTNEMQAPSNGTGGTAGFDSFIGKFADEASGSSGFQASIKPGTEVTTQKFEHILFRHPRRAIPLLEPGSASAATFQLACISFGVGIFVMPSVFEKVSLGVGISILIIFGIASNFCMQLMLQAAELTGATTFEDVLARAFGPAGRVMALVSLAVSTLTANCAHMQFVGQTWVEMGGPGGGIMATLVGSDDGLQQFVAKLIFGLLALPLCFKRQLSELRFVSVGVVIFCLFTSSVVCLKSVILISDPDSGAVHGKTWDVPAVGVMLDQVPAAAFGFSSIVELFHVRAEIKRPEVMSRCVNIASVIIVIVYLAVGLIGAMAFADPGSNMLENFPKSRFVAMLRLGIIIMITLLYPIINFPCAQAVLALRGNFMAPSMRSWRLVSVLGLVLVLFIDTVITDLGTVFGLAGALGLGLVAYVLPCSAFLVISWRQRQTTPLPTLIVIGALVVLILGLVMTLGSTGWIIRGVVVKAPAPAPTPAPPPSSWM